MNRIILLFFLFLVSYTNAQYNTLMRYIEWDEIDTLKKISFKSAIYPDTLTNFPYYSELLELPFSADISISNTIFEKFGNNILDKNTSLLPDSLVVAKYTGFSRKKNVISIRILPLYKDKLSNNIFRLKSFSIVINQKSIKKTLEFSAPTAEHSVLSTGKWYKIKLKKDGIYKISYSQLKDMGFTNPSNIHVYGNGGSMLPVNIIQARPDDLRENAIVNVNKGNDGYILFYGQAPDVWTFNNEKGHFFHKLNAFSDYNYYFITENQNKGLSISQATEPVTSNLSINTFDDYQFHEIDKTNILQSGAIWFGESFSASNSINLDFLFPNIISSERAFLYYKLGASSLTNTYFEINVGSKKFQTSSIPRKSSYTDWDQAHDTYEETDFVPQSENISLGLTYMANADNSAVGYLDYVGINVKRTLKLEGDQLLFRSTNSVGVDNIANFSIIVPTKDVEIWDITDVCSPKRMNTNYSNGIVSFIAETNTLRQFIVFKTNGNYLNPVIKSEIGDIGIIKNQDIHGAAIPDLIIVSPPDTGMLRQAQRLTDFRTNNDGLKVLLVSTDEIYNEFSSGKRDITAIRDMVRMFYNRASEDEIPNYLLLFGDGTYDNKTLFNSEKKIYNHNLIPTYQSEESYVKAGTYTSDDYYGWLDDTLSDENNFLDIGIGRLPVKDKEEAEIIVNKLINYSSNKTLGPWRNVITIIGDDNGDGDTPNNVHVGYSDDLANIVNDNYPQYITQKIYIDAYQNITTSVGQKSPDAENAINDRIANGTLILNYTGHGSINQLTHQAVINKESISKWQNYNKLFVFFTATCEFGRFDDLDIVDGKYQEKTSAGEKVLLNPDGGGIALFTATRVVYGLNNQYLNEDFYKLIFSKNKDGKYYRMGDIMRIIKNDYRGDDNKLKFALLGDPSAMLAFPKGNGVTTDSINGKYIDRKSIKNDSLTPSLSFDSICVDTIKALSIGRISGHIEDDNGNFNPDFNGIIYPIIFDKSDKRTTLGGPGQVPYEFETRESIIFKGLAEVKNGLFTFEFPVPKDIKYFIDKGKIVYYANNDETDLAGYSYNFKVGGINKEAEIDETGPKVKLYINDTTFRTGGITNSDPNLLVKLSDLNGINATGAGIGHDITAVIDSNFTRLYSLNESYQTDLGDFRKGTANFQFHDLSEGMHTIKVIAWDVYNNSAEGSISFKVIGNNNMVIQNVINYPNPFTEFTNFIFEHNWAGEDLDIEIQIYSFSGQLVNRLRHQEYAVGYRSSPISWNGTNNSGSKISSGIYLYKIVVNTKSGKHADGYGKLLLVRSK